MAQPDGGPGHPADRAQRYSYRSAAAVQVNKKIMVLGGNLDHGAHDEKKIDL